MSIDRGIGTPESWAHAKIETPTLLTRIGAHIFKAPSIENGGEKSGTRERAQVGASDLQASPLSEGDRRLWGIYSRRHPEAQGARLSVGRGAGGVDVGERDAKGIAMGMPEFSWHCFLA